MGHLKSFPPSGNNRIALFFFLTTSPSHSRRVPHIFWVARSAGLTARLPVFPVSDATEFLIRSLICRPESGNCATSPRILSSGFKKMTIIQTANQLALGITADPPPHPLSQPVTRLFQKPFDFSGVFLSRNKVNPFAGGAGLPSEVETWQNEDDRPASEEEEGEEERVLGRGGEGSRGVREEARNDTC